MCFSVEQKSTYSCKTSRSKDEVQSANDEKEKAINLAKKQEWDMKNLYAEVFKMSYKQNRLRTQAEQVII
jgi:hypothetical protein